MAEDECKNSLEGGEPEPPLQWVPMGPGARGDRSSTPPDTSRNAQGRLESVQERGENSLPQRILGDPGRPKNLENLVLFARPPRTPETSGDIRDIRTSAPPQPPGDPPPRGAHPLGPDRPKSREPLGRDGQPQGPAPPGARHPRVQPPWPGSPQDIRDIRGHQGHQPPGPPRPSGQHPWDWPPGRAPPGRGGFPKT